MFEWLRRKPAVAPDRLSNQHVLMQPARVARGRYDAAQTTSDSATLTVARWVSNVLAALAKGR